MKLKSQNINTLDVALILLIVLVLSVLLSIFVPSLTDKYILPISKIIGLLSVSSGIWIAVGEYRLKVFAEIRLGETSKAENDVKLLNLFAETFDIAHSRKNTIVSEKVIEKLFDKNVITSADYSNLPVMNQKLELAMRTTPVGLASQEAAITAIGELGARYPILRAAALQGLNSLKEQMPEQIGNSIQAAINKVNATG